MTTRNTLKSVAGLAAVAALATAIPAQAQQSASFTVDNQAYAFQLPSGFCLPTDAQMPEVNAIASLDAQNQTLAHLFTCDPNNRDYIIVKVPVQRQVIPLPKEQLIPLVANQIQSQFGQQQMQRETQTAREAVSEGTGGAIEMSESTMGYAGQDANCVYMRGSSVVTDAAGTFTVMNSSCLAPSGGYLIAIHAYGSRENGAQYEVLTSRASAVAQALTAQ